MTVLVGGVSELFQGDLDLGRLAAERLAAEGLGPDVLVEDLHYGAVAVAQRLEDLRPDSLVLVAAVRRGRAPGTVERRRIDPPQLAPDDLQAAVGNAVVGYVHVDLVVDVAAGLRVLPGRTVTVEVEPEEVDPGEGLSPSAAAGLGAALAIVRDEVRRAPLLRLADELRTLLEGYRLGDSASLRALHALLDELVRLDRDGRWGATFRLRDRLRLGIAAGASSEGMDHRDWGLWWALIEELDRLEALEARPVP
ncbi:hypothetical protein [Geodermatophilus chilensis]|uniref:hypothetical protein n=1 Tax=Geodermatophilus chilensis TaxID=2035835 RepID=UPI000C267B09|nr:hypothetical protein [Geodermatophilus chilensis]